MILRRRNMTPFDTATTQDYAVGYFEYAVRLEHGQLHGPGPGLASARPYIYIYMRRHG